ncbi:hypothetical protein [Streptomyces sp. Tu 6176]|uniref:hypothetical protein n=1 Tax=Streptomyces sp. Tu 6176 TaxID=1470557 RepID=UPI000AFF8A91|nr:hypothetical protein [Streptomyces sp. Tu 6176]
MPDDLYQRYMAAHRANQEHAAACFTCTGTARCPAGQRLYDRFAVLQDAYLAAQKKRRP